MQTHDHIPVLLPELLAELGDVTDRTIIDATFGRGGYSSALLESGATIIAIDRDPDAIAAAGRLKKRHPKTFTAIHGRFSAMKQLTGEHLNSEGNVYGVVFDLGVSSPQLDDEKRGFGFRHDAPLDMRMEKQGTTAADIVNSATETELKTIFKNYGEEPKAAKIAGAIVAARTNNPITTTRQLAELVESISPRRYNQKGGQKKHPATRIFQALRIAVNDELDELQKGLSVAVTMLDAGGKIAVVSFHSLEDRMVKRLFAELGRPQNPSRHAPMVKAEKPKFHASGKAITPDDAAILQNPRCRSAKLRILHKLTPQPTEDFLS